MNPLYFKNSVEFTKRSKFIQAIAINIEILKFRFCAAFTHVLLRFAKKQVQIKITSLQILFFKPLQILILHHERTLTRLRIKTACFFIRYALQSTNLHKCVENDGFKLF